MPCLPALPLDDVVVGQDVDGLTVAGSEVFSSLESGLRCAVESPANGEYPKKGSGAQGQRSDASALESVAMPVLASIAVGTGITSHLLVVESEVTGGNV